MGVKLPTGAATGVDKPGAEPAKEATKPVGNKKQ